MGNKNDGNAKTETGYLLGNHRPHAHNPSVGALGTDHPGQTPIGKRPSGDGYRRRVQADRFLSVPSGVDAPASCRPRAYSTGRAWWLHGQLSPAYQPLALGTKGVAHARLAFPLTNATDTPPH